MKAMASLLTAVAIAVTTATTALLSPVTASEAKADLGENPWTGAQILSNPFFKTNGNWSGGVYDNENHDYLSTITDGEDGLIYQSVSADDLVVGHAYYFETKATYTSENELDYIFTLSVSNTAYISNDLPGYQDCYYYKGTPLESAPASDPFVTISFYNPEQDQDNAVFTFNYAVLFDLTAIYAGSVPSDPLTIHQQFLAYASGYEQGMSDGEKSYITTTIDDFDESSGSLSVGSPETIYRNYKWTGEYYSSSQNIYWQTSAYGQMVTAYSTGAPTRSLAGYYFQYASFTKYKNTTENDITFNTALTFSGLGSSGTAVVNYKVLYTTISMDTFLDVSTFNTIVPIRPSDNFVNLCEVLTDDNANVAISADGDGLLGVEASRSGITDTAYNIFILADFTFSPYIGGDDPQAVSWSPTSTVSTFIMDKALNYIYEVVDLPGMFFTVLESPFVFLSTFTSNTTLFGGTPYQINIGSILIGVIGVIILIWIVELVLKFVGK